MHSEHRQCTYQHPLIRGRKPKFYRPELERDKDQIHYNVTSDQSKAVVVFAFLKQYNKNKKKHICPNRMRHIFVHHPSLE